MPALTLVNIVLKFIQEDPLLKNHITYTPDDPEGDMAGVFLGACAPLNEAPYAIACVSNKHRLAQTWEWDLFTPAHDKRVTFCDLVPEDPNFFEKLRAGLIIAHNSLSSTHLCKI